MSVTDAHTDAIANRLPSGLLDRIVAQVNPRRVILFGSQATDKTHPDSDWDFLIVVDDETPADRLNWRIMGDIRRGLRGAIDLVPMRESTFRRKEHVIGSLAWSVAREGVVVYERPE